MFCYPKCEEGARPVGPVCWGYCPTGTHQCGVLCQGENETCLSKIGKMTMESLATVGFVASQNYPSAAMSAAGIVIDLVYPICSSFNAPGSSQTPAQSNDGRLYTPRQYAEYVESLNVL